MNMKNKFYLFFGLLSLGMLSGAANATLFTFSLADSVAGNERPPNYGLRLDGLYSGDQRDIYTFAFVDVDLTVDSSANSVCIGGTLLGGTDGYGEERDTDWLLDFLYTDVQVNVDGTWSLVKDVSTGTGSIEQTGNGDTFALANYNSATGGLGGFDSGRCRTGDSPLCGNGWLIHSILPGQSVDINSQQLRASDFLYSGTPTAVPEPSVFALFGIGLVGLGFARRRRQS